MRTVLATPWLAAALAASAQTPLPPQDAATIARIDGFVAAQVEASGLPGVAIALLQAGRAPHVRGFGDDGRGKAITGDTPFPIGSLTKSFTALLVRQAIEAGQLEIDAPVQRWLPWFRVANAQASSRITLRHLLNQTSGLSRADGIAPLLEGRRESIEEVARGMSAVALNRPLGERFEYSNLNYVLLGAVLQAATGKTWDALLHERVLRPLAMEHSHTDHDAARRDGMTALHRMWFGRPVAHEQTLPPGFAPTGSLIASANDMARCLEMLLAEGVAPSGRMLSAQGVAQMLAPGSPSATVNLLAADFALRYGEGWFVGAFGAAADARWHLGNLASFAAWMVLLPQTKQAVVVLVNANTELPFGKVNAVMSRLPIGVVNLLHGQAAPQGPSLREAYRRFNAIVAASLLMLAALACWAARARRAWGAALLALIAAGLLAALYATGLRPSLLSAFAPDLALASAAASVLSCAPLLWRALRR